MLFAIGLVLSSTARILETKKISQIAWIELGAACFITGIEIAVKPTTSIILFGSILFFCLFSPLLPIRFKGRLVAFLVPSGVLGIAAIGIFLRSWSALVLRISVLHHILKDAEYKQQLVTRVIGEFQNLGRLVCFDLRLPATIFGASLVVLVAGRGRWRRNRVFAVILILTIYLIWLGAAISGQLWQAGHSYYAKAAVARFYLEGIAVSGAALAILKVTAINVSSPSNAGIGKSVHLFLLWSMLVALPFAGSFGTTNPIYLNAAFQATCWAAALVVVLVMIAHRCGSFSPCAIALLPIGVFASAQFINGHVLHPYALRTGLLEQNTPTGIGVPQTVMLLDAPTSAFILGTRRILDTNGFRPGDDIFAFFNLPGLVFAVGGRSPVIPWYFGRIYSGDTIEESYMLAAGDSRRQRAWIITQADVTTFREHFIRGGLKFPDDYSVVGVLTNPVTGLDVRIWKHRS
jgi:hypothetical protein